MNPPESICPGYQQVEEFGSDDEYEDEYEEEIEYITLDLGNVEPSLVPSSSTYRLIGLDTPTPFLQLSGMILKGNHESLLGTELLFTDDKERNEPGQKGVTYVATTEKRIAFKEVRLRAKENSRNLYNEGEYEEEEVALEYVDSEPELVPELAESSNTQQFSSQVQAVVDSTEAGDPAMLIERLTGITAPLIRRRGAGKKGKGKAESSSSKKKGKQKAVDIEYQSSGVGDGKDVDQDGDEEMNTEE